MRTDRFTLTKKTGTYADALAAMGLGRMLFRLTHEHPMVRDEGAAYVCTLSQEYVLDALDYTSLHGDPGYPYMLLKPPDEAAPSSGFIDYTGEREKLKIWRERRETLRKAHGGRLTKEDEEELKNVEPMRGWYLYQNLNVLQAYNSYNAVHSAIRCSDPVAFAESVCAKLVALAIERDPADVATPFVPKVAAVQAFNPAVGKGINRPKPDGPALGSLPGSFVDWFEEWLRYIGVHLAANSLSVGDKGDDIKLFVMAPANLDESEAQGVRDSFVGLRLPWTPAKIDILGALGLAKILIERSGLLEDAGGSRLGALISRTPRDVVGGLQSAYFTSLGSARALTNTSFIGLPGWFPVNTASVNDWLGILEEHENVIRALDEERSEQASLLVSYRNFLSAGERGIGPLLSFLASYAGYVMRARDRKHYAPQFTVTNLGRLLERMSSTNGKPLRPILDDEGFKHIAAAIRRATVTEQFYNSRGQQQYEIHYGLFQDLERKARFRDQFVAALSAFITD